MGGGGGDGRAEVKDRMGGGDGEHKQRGTSTWSSSGVVKRYGEEGRKSESGSMKVLPTRWKGFGGGDEWGGACLAGTKGESNREGTERG